MQFFQVNNMHLCDHQVTWQEDISECQTATLPKEIVFYFKADLHFILLAPQIHTGGRTGCVPLAFRDYGEIKKKWTKLREKANIGTEETWIKQHVWGKQGVGRNKEGEKKGESPQHVQGKPDS